MTWSSISRLMKFYHWQVKFIGDVWVDESERHICKCNRAKQKDLNGSRQRNPRQKQSYSKVYLAFPSMPILVHWILEMDILAIFLSHRETRDLGWNILRLDISQSVWILLAREKLFKSVKILDYSQVTVFQLPLFCFYSI